MISRRDFLKLSAASMAALYASAHGKLLLRARACQSGTLTKFMQPLRGVFPLDPNGIPVAVPDGERAWKRAQTAAQHYTIDINQYTDQLHPDLGPTTLWGYNPRSTLGGPSDQRHLGGIIVAHRGHPVQLTVQNNLPNQHILPVDETIMGVIGSQVNRTDVHLHGGLVPWISDGGPYAWFDDAGHYGPSAESGGLNIFRRLNPGLLPGQAEYYYPMDQSARILWYHDHAVGITRLNAYAGIASGLILRDDYEGGLRNLGLPDFIENGGREIPLVFQDKVFVGDDISTADPGWLELPVPGTNGSLWYPHVYDADQGPGYPPPDTNLSVVPEMFGDTMLVNGTVYPVASVEPRRYRLRVLNACQARFLNLQLYEDNGSGQPDKTKAGPAFLVIGTEGGFLSKPASVPSNVPFNPVTLGGSLITAPAERWDILIDFKEFAGKSLILYNDAPAPFPMGDEANDFDSQCNVGPDTRTLMRFDVATGITGPADPPLQITPETSLQSYIDPSLVGMWTGAPLPPPPGVRTRQLTLNESFDEFGRLIQMLGTNKLVAARTEDYGRGYLDTATETPHAGDTEIWQIANLTGDTHPIHFHLVNVQLLSRQPFDSYAKGRPAGLGAPRGPEATELGWKETVKMHPNEITTVIMRFDLPQVPFSVPSSPRTGGNEYVWHCHILEHEEHDMMRPLIVS